MNMSRDLTLPRPPHIVAPPATRKVNTHNGFNTMSHGESPPILATLFISLSILAQHGRAAETVVA